MDMTTGVSVPETKLTSKIAEAFLLIWRYKIWIAVATACTTIGGIAIALLSTPVYSSIGTIVPKEAQGSSSGGFLSQLGGLGGMVASSVGSGNSPIDRVEVVLKGYDLASTVIEQNNLMPALFPDRWDAAKGEWKASIGSKGKPTMRVAADYLRKEVLTVRITPKKKLINVGAQIYDSTLAAKIANLYIDALNKKIQQDVLQESEMNQKFLAEQTLKTSDPLVREKIQNLIYLEIEKSMLVSSNSFDILERPMVPIIKLAPNKKKIVILSFLIGFAASFGIIFSWKRCQSHFEEIFGAIRRGMA